MLPPILPLSDSRPDFFNLPRVLIGTLASGNFRPGSEGIQAIMPMSEHGYAMANMTTYSHGGRGASSDLLAEDIYDA